MSATMKFPDCVQNLELYARIMLGFGTLMFPFILPLLFSRLFTGKPDEGLSNEEVWWRESQDKVTGGCCVLSSFTGLFVVDQVPTGPEDLTEILASLLLIVHQSAIHPHLSRVIQPRNALHGIQRTTYIIQAMIFHHSNDPMHLQESQTAEL